MATNGYVTRIAGELGLAQGPEGVLYGEADGALLTLKVIGNAPLWLQVKVRCNRRAKPRIDLDDGLRSLLGEREHRIDLDSDCVCISFLDVADLEADSLLAFLYRTITVLSDAGCLEDPGRCFSCARETGDLEVVYKDGRPSKLCAACIESSARQRRREREQARREEPAMLLMVLPALLLSAGTWAAFWVGYDKLFQFFGTDEIMIPQIVILAVLFVVGSVAARPLGLALRRSGVLRSVPVGLLVPLLVGGIVFAGEVLYLKLSLSRVSIPAVVSNFVPLVRCYGVGFVIAKLCLAVGLGVGIVVCSADKDDALAS